MARGTVVVAALALLLPMVSACGFTPLYATPGVSAGLSSIEVVAPRGRVPYLLREDLDDALGRDKDTPPAWRLDMVVTQTRDPRGLNRADVAEYYDVGLTVNYTLTSLQTGKVAHTGQVRSIVSYDDTTAPYNGIAARQNRQELAASDAARRIQIQLAAWMATRAPG